MPSHPTQRILVRGVNWLGDAVMTTPALQRLREARPDAHITLLTHAKLKGIWDGHPAVDAVETFDEGEGAWRIGRRLRDGKFDLGLVLPNSPRAALELWRASIPERVGYDRPWRNALLTRVVPSRPGAVAMFKRSKAEIEKLISQNTGGASIDYPADAHQIHEYLHLVAALGANPEPLAPRLAITEATELSFLSRFGVPTAEVVSQLFFGLNAGAEYGPAKRWPEARFIEAAIQIQRQTKCRWLVFGLQSEREAAERITASICSVAGSAAAMNLAGATSLGELCAGLKLCRVLLTNDSGPMHVAAAVGTPVVAPFGSTSPELTGPVLPGDKRHSLLRANVPCSPCFLRECPIDFRCMTGISVEQVAQAVVDASKAESR